MYYIGFRRGAIKVHYFHLFILWPVLHNNNIMYKDCI